jgi:hypothetical protein
MAADEIDWQRSQSAATRKPLPYMERFFFFWKRGFRYLLPTE